MRSNSRHRSDVKKVLKCTSETERSKKESELGNTVVPTGLGRLPVSIEVGCFLTADQWENWTIYFSMYCLGDLLPQPQLECWRHFVLACRRLCKYSVTDNDITLADALLLKFCKQTVQLYGSGNYTEHAHALPHSIMHQRVWSNP